MKKAIPINTTADGCAFTIVTRYEGRAYLKSMTGGGGYYPCTGVLEIVEESPQCVRGRDLQDDIHPARQTLLGELPGEA